MHWKRCCLRRRLHWSWAYVLYQIIFLCVYCYAYEYLMFRFIRRERIELLLHFIIYLHLEAKNDRFILRVVVSSLSSTHIHSRVIFIREQYSNSGFFSFIHSFHINISGRIRIHIPPAMSFNSRADRSLAFCRR